MCNSGKFIDRSPSLRAAGMVCQCNETIDSSMKVFPKYELAQAWLKAKHCPIERIPEFFPCSPILPNVTIQESLTPELLKSHFVRFREQFFEDLYLKKAKLGKSVEVHTIPDNIDKENTIFGRPTPKSEKLYSLVLPPRSVADVNREYVAAHDKYVFSHRHFLPGEQIYRRYNLHFDPDMSYGQKSNMDKTGGQVKRCMLQRDKVMLVKELQKYYLDTSFANVGAKVHKFRDNHLTDPNVIFGHPPNPDRCRLKDIVHNIDPCEDNDERINAIAHLIHLRHAIQVDAQFDIFALEMDLERHERAGKGYVPLSVALETAHHHQLHFNSNRIRHALILYKLVENVGKPNEKILIEDFSKALQMRFLLPELEHLPIEVPNVLDTTYRELCRDHEKPQPVGITYRKLPIDDGGDGIGIDCFDNLREKAQLKRIFVDIVNAEVFENIWQLAKQRLKTEGDLMSINDFRAVLREMRAECESLKKKKG